MDVRMPEMDGLEASRRIRALPRTPDKVPIIALTAQAFMEQIAECRAAGMDSDLTKPFSPEALLAVIAQPSTPSAAAPTRSPSRRKRKIHHD